VSTTVPTRASTLLYWARSWVGERVGEGKGENVS
jgi:hypothetical protein